MDNIITAHKRLEQMLWHLVMIADQADEGIAMLDLNGTLQFVNPAWAAMHSYNTTNELVGKHISVFHTEEQMIADVTPFIEETKHRGRLAGPAEHMRRDGRLI